MGAGWSGERKITERRKRGESGGEEGREKERNSELLWFSQYSARFYLFLIYMLDLEFSEIP